VDILSKLTELEELGCQAFEGCCSLTTVDLIRTVKLTQLHRNTFRGCRALMAARLPPNLTSLGLKSFMNCRAMTSILLPPRLESIDRGAFLHCGALVRVVIPALVQTIGRHAFASCTSLATVTFQSTQHLRSCMDNEQFHCCVALEALEFQGHVPPRHLWPWVLEQILRDNNSEVLSLGDPVNLLAGAGIGNPKQRVRIAWNFLRSNVTDFFSESKHINRRRGRS